ELRQGGDVALHGENPVCNEQLATLAAFNFSQDVFARLHVLVRENLYFGAREPAAVDDGGMIELVRDDDVFASQDGLHRSRIGGESGLENHRSLDVFEPGDFLLQLHVDRHGAGDGAHRAGAYAPFLDRFQGARAELGVSGQPQVVVRGKVDDLAAIEPGDGKLLGFEHAQLLVELLLAQLVQF